MVPFVASKKKSPVTPLAIDPETFQLVAQCLNHYATQEIHILYTYKLMLVAEFADGYECHKIVSCFVYTNWRRICDVEEWHDC